MDCVHCYLFNILFMTGSYPYGWTNAKRFPIFKRGSKLAPSNYRLIDVINNLAKVCDMLLCARLNQWFVPRREQTQPGGAGLH